MSSPVSSSSARSGSTGSSSADSGSSGPSSSVRSSDNEVPPNVPISAIPSTVPMRATPLAVKYPEGDEPPRVPPRVLPGPRRSRRLAPSLPSSPTDSSGLRILESRPSGSGASHGAEDSSSSSSSKTSTPVARNVAAGASQNPESANSESSGESTPSGAGPQALTTSAEVPEGPQVLKTSTEVPEDPASSEQEVPPHSSRPTPSFPGFWSYDSIKSELSPDDLVALRAEFSIPESISLRIPGEGELPSSPPVGEVALNRVFFECGLRLPFPPFLQKLLTLVNLSPLQLHPNIWRGIFSCFVLWRELFQTDPTPDEIQACFGIRQTQRRVGSYYYYPRTRGRFLDNLPETSNWQKSWFFVGENIELNIPGARPKLLVPPNFQGHDHGWSSSNPTLSDLHDSRVEKVMKISLSERRPNLLLMRDRLNKGTPWGY